MTEQKKAGYPPIERVIGTIASITTVAILFATQRAQLSFPAQVAVVSVIGILIILLFVWIWYRPIVGYRTERGLAGREDKVSRESLAKFQTYVEHLKTTCSPQRMDSLVYVLNNLKGQAEFQRLPTLFPWTYYVDALSFQMMELFKRVEINRQTFVWAVDSFTLVLRLFCDGVNSFVNEARQAGEQKPIPKHIKEDFNTNRQTFIRYLEDYTGFVEGLNKQFRRYVETYPVGGGTHTVTSFTDVYVEKPKEL